MKRFIPCLLLMVAARGWSQGFSPVNSSASPEARDLLRYLYSINGRQLLSGQHNYNQSMGRFDDSVYAMTGKYPAV